MDNTDISTCNRGDAENREEAINELPFRNRIVEYPYKFAYPLLFSESILCALGISVVKNAS